MGMKPRMSIIMPVTLPFVNEKKSLGSLPIWMSCLQVVAGRRIHTNQKLSMASSMRVVRLMIKGIAHGETIENLTKVFMVRVPLRLGQDAFTLGRISNDKTGKLLRLVKAFRQLMQIYNVQSYRACATSAMRDAENGREVTKYIVEKTGVEIEIEIGRAHV